MGIDKGDASLVEASTSATNHSEISSLVEPTPIGEILMRRGQLRKFQLDFLLQLQKAYKKIAKNFKIGELLIKHRALTPLALTEALAVQEEMPRESITQILKLLEGVNTQTKLA
ncbi:MAG: hypothetical protein J0L93_10715 [Deltaproteobacteria bacterium]|nr:hypothetical protein [Deltaproteobacteria bacterium]